MSDDGVILLKVIVLIIGIMGLLLTAAYTLDNGLWLSSLTVYILVASALWSAIKTLSSIESFEEIPLDCPTIAFYAIAGFPAFLICWKVLGKWDFHILSFNRKNSYSQ